MKTMTTEEQAEKLDELRSALSDLNRVARHIHDASNDMPSDYDDISDKLGVLDEAVDDAINEITNDIEELENIRREVRCVVACMYNKRPTIISVRVNATVGEIEAGRHYAAAKEHALITHKCAEPMVAFSEDDFPFGKIIIDNIDITWETTPFLQVKEENQ